MSQIVKGVIARAKGVADLNRPAAYNCFKRIRCAAAEIGQRYFD